MNYHPNILNFLGLSTDKKALSAKYISKHLIDKMFWESINLWDTCIQESSKCLDDNSIEIKFTEDIINYAFLSTDNNNKFDDILWSLSFYSGFSRYPKIIINKKNDFLGMHVHPFIRSIIYKAEFINENGNFTFQVENIANEIITHLKQADKLGDDCVFITEKVFRIAFLSGNFYLWLTALTNSHMRNTFILLVFYSRFFYIKYVGAKFRDIMDLMELPIHNDKIDFSDFDFTYLFEYQLHIPSHRDDSKLSKVFEHYSSLSDHNQEILHNKLSEKFGVYLSKIFSLKEKEVYKYFPQTSKSDLEICKNQFGWNQ